MVAQHPILVTLRNEHIETVMKEYMFYYLS